jgi:hypothetical protein
MAKVQFNASIAHVRGRIDGWVYKYYKDKRGWVVSRDPDMSGIKPSAAQLAQRRRMAQGGALYRKVQDDPVLLAKYQRRARRRGTTVQLLCTSEVLRAK